MDVCVCVCMCVCVCVHVCSREDASACLPASCHLLICVCVFLRARAYE